MFDNLPDKDECRKNRELIQKRLDDEISPAENVDLNVHLADCDSCREELVSYLTVQSLLKETVDEMVEVPEGLFESLEEQLEEVKPARGLAAIFHLPAFTSYRNLSFAAASLVLMALLTVGVIQDHLGHADRGASLRPELAGAQALIRTNHSGTIVLPVDEGNSDLNAAALNDLEKAYEESRSTGANDGSETQGYIHTSWRGRDSASPIQ